MIVPMLVGTWLLINQQCCSALPRTLVRLPNTRADSPQTDYMRDERPLPLIADYPRSGEEELKLLGLSGLTVKGKDDIIQLDPYRMSNEELESVGHSISNMDGGFGNRFVDPPENPKTVRISGYDKDNFIRFARSMHRLPKLSKTFKKNTYYDETKGGSNMGFIRFGKSYAPSDFTEEHREKREPKYQLSNSFCPNCVEGQNLLVDREYPIFQQSFLKPLLNKNYVR